MAKVEKRLTIHVTEAQYEAFRVTMQAIRETNDSDALRWILKEFVNAFGPGWPDDKITWGGKREGAGWPKGRPRKSGGRKSKIAT